MRRYAAEIESASETLQRGCDGDRHDKSLSASVQERVARHQLVLSQVKERVPETARSAVEHAIAVSKRAEIGATGPEDEIPAPSLEIPTRTLKPTQLVTPTQPFAAGGSPTPAEGHETGPSDVGGGVTPPGLIRTPQAPGLMMTPARPRRTPTPQAPGGGHTRQPPGQTRTPAPPVHTPGAPGDGATQAPPGQPDPPDPPVDPGPPEEDEKPGPPEQRRTPGRP